MWGHNETHIQSILPKWGPHLAVGVDHGPQQLPGSSAAVHTQHPEDLQEAETSDGGRGEHVALGTGRQHRHRRNQHHHVWPEGRRRLLFELCSQVRLTTLSNFNFAFM